MESNAEILEMFRQNRQSCSEVCEIQHQQTNIDMLFYHGKTSAIEAVVGHDIRTHVNINLIKSPIDKVSGFLRQIRRGTALDPREGNSDVKEFLYDSMENALASQRDNANMDILESDQDKDMVMGGMGVVVLGIDFTKDSNGAACIKSIDPRTYCWDTSAQDRNLTDRNWDYFMQVMPSAIAAKKFNVDPDELDPAPDDWDDYLFGRYVKENSIPAYTNPERGKLSEGFGNFDTAITQFNWRTLDTFIKYTNPVFRMAEVDPQMAIAFRQALDLNKQEMYADMNNSDEYESIKTLRFDPTKDTFIVPRKYKKLIDQTFELFQIEPDFEEVEQFVYKTAYLSAVKGVVLRKQYGLSQSQFASQVKTATFDHESRTYYGLVRMLREPSMFLNKTVSEQIYILSRQAKGGAMVESSAIYDINEFQEQYAKTDGVIEVQDGALSGGKIQPKDAGVQRGTAYDGMFGEFGQLFNSVLPLNPEFLGTSDNKQVSGALEQTRIKQVTYALAEYVDSITLYMRESTRWMLDALRFLVDYNDSFVASVAGEDGARELVELTEEMVDIDYDVIIKEAPLSPIAKEQKFQTVFGMASTYAQVTGNTSLFEDAALQLDGLGFTQNEIQGIVGKLQPPQADPVTQQQQMAIQQQQLQMEMAKAQAELANKQADTAKKLADVDKTEADTMHSEAETERVAVETTKAAQMPVESLNINL